MHPPAVTSARPEGEAPPSSKGNGGAADQTVSGFFAIVASLPTSLRAGIAALIVIVAGGVGYEHYAPHGGDLSKMPLYTNGIPDPTHAGADSNNPQNIEADDKAREDQSAAAWHLAHEDQDRPEEIPIDPERRVFYRYYAKSDHCVFIRRNDGDRVLMQWVRDPSFHAHDVHHDHPPRRAEAPPAATNRGWLARASDLVVPAISAQGNCVNPHPGQFRYWWGQPIDSCNSPMYRQFPDGCTHYQVYNRCANAWDSRISWTTCVARHNE